MRRPILQVRDLTVEVQTPRGTLRPVVDVSFDVVAGEIHGVVGESGSGKSTLLRAVMGLLPSGTGITGGSIVIDGVNTMDLCERDRHKMRGSTFGMVFQDPSSALSPVFTVGSQLIDGPMRHLGLDRRSALRRAIELLERVGVPEPQTRLGAYPHQLSGGLRQRVMIAIALSSKPKLLLCDEPTTALDVTIQDQILGLLEDIRRNDGVAIVFVSHNLAVVASLCHQVSVMYAGRIVESGLTNEIFRAPRHPYTIGLMKAMPDVWAGVKKLAGIPGITPDLMRLPQGCAFAPRCSFAQENCLAAVPVLKRSRNHQVACVRPYSALKKTTVAEHV